MNVNFYDCVDDSLLKFAVIIAKSEGKWVFCKHKERSTYEIPGGHREADEEIEECAIRELMEETGAIKFTLESICIYAVTGKTRVNKVGNETFGKLFYAEIEAFDPDLHCEIEKILLLNELPNDESWTYPMIQPLLINEFKRRRKSFELT